MLDRRSLQMNHGFHYSGDPSNNLKSHSGVSPCFLGGDQKERTHTHTHTTRQKHVLEIRRFLNNPFRTTHFGAADKTCKWPLHCGPMRGRHQGRWQDKRCRNRKPFRMPCQTDLRRLSQNAMVKFEGSGRAGGLRHCILFWAMIKGGAKRMGGGTRTTQRTLLKIFFHPPPWLPLNVSVAMPEASRR